MREEEDIHDVLMRYLSGEASDEENSLVEDWLKGAGNQAELEKVKRQLERFGEYRGQATVVNTNAAWKNVSDRLGLSISKDEVKVISIFSRVPIAIRYAAAVALFVGSYFLFKPALTDTEESYMAQEQIAPKMTLASNNEVKVLELSEGSKITLRENTIIRYKDMTRDSVRLVELDKGEAYFEVARDENKVFIVQTETSFIKVLGTAFSVRVSDSGEVEVSVTKGIVRLFSDTLMNEITKHIDLIKGQVAKRNNKGLFRLESGSWNAISWLTGNLRFNNEPMISVIEDLKNHYDVNIIVKDTNFLNCRLTAKFKKKDVEAVLETLKLTFDIEIDIVTEEGNIIIKGKGC